MAAAGVSLSPLSASLEPLLVAITIEFAILVEGRMEAERRLGADPQEAGRTAVRWVGAPVLVSASTVGLGFAVLLISPVPVLRQFGGLAAVEVVSAAALALALVPAFAAALAPAPTRATPLDRSRVARTSTR
jgi:predicted RND superfamily exporter protein